MGEECLSPLARLLEILFVDCFPRAREDAARGYALSPRTRLKKCQNTTLEERTGDLKWSVRYDAEIGVQCPRLGYDAQIDT